MTTPVSSRVIPAPAGFIRLPNLFRQQEVDAIATDPNFWVAELSRDADGVLYGVWTRTVDVVELGRQATDRSGEENGPQEAVSPGELKVRRRAEHLCFGCSHYAMCRIAHAIDEKFLVTITRCLAFFPVEADPEPSTERRPLAPRPAP